MKKTARVILLTAMLGVFFAVLNTGSVFAAGVGDGGGDEAGSNAGPCTTGNCYSSKYGAVWVYYKYSEKKDLKFPNPNYSVSDSPQTVSKTCGEVGGFWFLGYAGRDGNNVPTGYQLGPVNFGNTTLGSGSIPMLSRNSKVFLNLVYTNDEKYHYVTLESGKRGKPVDRNKWNLHSGYSNVTAVKVGSVNEVRDAYVRAQMTKGSNGKSVLPSPYNKADWGDSKMYDLVWFCSKEEDNEIQGGFKSKSAVKTEKGETLNEDYDDHDGKADPYKITIPTSQESTDVVFSHRIRIAASDERFDAFKKGGAYTEYKVTQSGYDDKTVVKKTKLYAKDLEDMANYPNLHNKIVGENKVNVKVDKGKTVTICQKITYSPQTFSIKNGSFQSGKDDEYSQICVQVYREPDNDIPGAFYSQSSVSGVTTNRDENRTTPVKTIEMSADETSGSVTFNHIIGSELAGDVYNKAVGAGANTTWTVSQTSYNPNGNVRTGTTYMGSLSNVSGTNVYAQNVVSIPVNVSVSQNSYATVCQKITYTTKNFVIKNNSFNPQGNSGSSSICIRLHRPSTSYYCRNVLSGYLSNASYGNTVAETKVKMDNSNGTTGWKDTILAKPSDEIQFRHTLCFGAQAVTSSGRYTNGTYRRKSSQLSEEEFPSNYFYLSGYRDNDYLFNRRDDGVVYIPRATAKPTTFYYSPNGGVTSFKPEETYQDYGIRFYSPKNASTGGATSYSTNPYNCEINTFLSGWTLGFKANAYRIPGFDYGACNSAANVAVNNSDVGSEIRQNLHYNDVEAWIQWKHDKSNAICQGCESYYDGAGGSEPRAEPIYRQYLGSAREAANSGGWIWGYLEQDCKQTRCSNSGYQYKDSTTGCTNNPETSNCSYRSWSTANVGCSLGYHRGENTYPYSTTGNGHYYSDWYCHTNNQNVRDTKYNNPSNRTPGSSVTYGAGITDYEQQKTATVKIPYNFKTETTAKITGGDVVGGVVYAGEPADSTFAVKVKSRINPDVDPYRNYLTITPSNTVVQFISFTVNSHVSESTANDAVKGGISYGNENIVSYFSRKFGRIDNIHTLYSRYGAVNGEGNLNGPVFAQGSSMTYSESIPDVEVGSKYCVAVGISHADSHGIPDLDLRAGQGVYGYSMSGANPSWRISNASCRTIAKKPNFQAWGGVYTPGGILTSQSPKSRINNTFGSWVDTLAIANKSIIANKRYSGFSSGAGLGYIGSGGGANGTGLNYCNLTKMTIANNLCSSKITGNAGGITTFNPLEQLLSRYTPETKEPRSGYNLGSQPTQTLNGGGLYTYTKENANMGPLTVTSGTRVIEIDKNLTIDHNICAGTGSCQSTGYNNLTLRDRNNHTYYSNSEGIGNIPQVIIIVRGNVKISSEVTQIDAWLFVDGTIDTCYGGFSDSNSCNKTLIFNGPVFANKLALNRTAGAYPGPNAFGSAYYDQDLASSNRGVDYYSGNYTDPKYGSITPAEIFNLRPDTYFWAYNQANRLSQAQVVYMRELAPRY